jgi:hypothetical protein
MLCLGNECYISTISLQKPGNIVKEFVMTVEMVQSQQSLSSVRRQELHDAAIDVFDPIYFEALKFVAPRHDSIQDLVGRLIFLRSYGSAVGAQAVERNIRKESAALSGPLDEKTLQQIEAYSILATPLAINALVVHASNERGRSPDLNDFIEQVEKKLPLIDQSESVNEYYYRKIGLAGKSDDLLNYLSRISQELVTRDGLSNDEALARIVHYETALLHLFHSVQVVNAKTQLQDPMIIPNYLFRDFEVRQLNVSASFAQTTSV